MEKEPLVSIIVPIYNVEKYLKQCLSSIVNQTYRNIEIILVNDGSTDHSLEMAYQWKHRDGRIKLIEQHNKGLGPARNSGLSVADGEYVAFVDSDDWIHEDFIKNMLHKALENDAELVYCNINKVWTTDAGATVRSSRMVFPHLAEGGFRAEDYPEVISHCGSWTWNKLYKTGLWKRLELVQPADTVEDLCSIFVLLVKAGRIAYADGLPLYQYRQRTEGLSYADSFPRHYINAICAAEENYVRYQIDKKFWFHVGKVFGDSLTFVKLYLEEKKELTHEIADMEACFCKTFLKEKTEESLIFGSFNLRSMVREGYYYIPEYFGFSSLISAMNPPDFALSAISHPNPMRSDALYKDRNGIFRETLKQKRDGIKWIFFDVLEERFDIIRLNTGGYITRSEAFMDVMGTQQDIGQVVPSGTPEFIELWKESCRKFRMVLEKQGFNGNIVLVRNHLSESYGSREERKNFPEVNELRKINEMLCELEEYFIKTFPESITVDLTSDSGYYTDEFYAHGCFPWHLNNEIYLEAGKKISPYQAYRSWT